MSVQTAPMYAQDAYAPTQTDELLWWLATAEKELIKDCMVDRNRYRIIGMSVLATWIFATLAWTYFFSTVIDNVFLYAGSGLFMGFVILSIDRALIKGINQFNKKKFTPLLFRGLLALTIGTFMAQPAILYMFDKEIKMQVSLDNEKRKLTKRNELDLLYKNRKDELLKEKAALQNGLNTKYADVNTAREKFIAETDGSGGTGKIGIKDIALAKRNEYQKLDEEYKALQATAQQRINIIDEELNTMETTIKKQEADFLNYLNTGFLTRIEAMNNLLKENGALQFRYYLILIILMLIELMPVIAKTLLPVGVYDEKVKQREALEIQMTQESADYEKNMKRLYNKLAMQQDTETMEEFFRMQKEEQKSKLSHFGKDWKRNDENVQGFWQKIKQQMISRPEN
ncbi:MAG: DUF4407 domain-containing protein [Chitinophagaceae bacterium]|nr:DUF4407 domain-containing protein [Chitinophagaceae bacterium]